MTRNKNLSALAGELQGAMFVRGDDGYAEACAAWELSVTHRPDVVVMVETAADVRAAVRFARRERLEVAVQGPGHGQLWACEGGMLVNTSRMRRVSIDPGRAVARVEAGVQWKDVLPEAARYGLAALCGSSPEVGVVGYTLGGGTGWLARKYGYASDSVVAAEIVTGDGRLLRASEHENTDLFWAIRGAGTVVGIVTALEFRLYPLARVYGGSLIFPVERAREVFLTYASWTRIVPEELTSSISIQHLPPLPSVPEPLRGRSVVSVDVCYAGPANEAEEFLGPLRGLSPMIDSVAMMDFKDVGRIANEPVNPMRTFIGTETLADLTPESIARLIERVGDRSRTSLAVIAVRHIEGAYRKLPEDASAVSRPDAKFVLLSIAPVMVPAMEPRIAADTSALMNSLRPWKTGTPVRNFVTWSAAGRAEEMELFSARKYAKLSRIRERYDPDGILRSGVRVAPRPELVELAG